MNGSAGWMLASLAFCYPRVEPLNLLIMVTAVDQEISRGSKMVCVCGFKGFEDGEWVLGLAQRAGFSRGCLGYEILWWVNDKCWRGFKVGLVCFLCCIEIGCSLGSDTERS